jgi:hypothetical protein
MGGDDLPKFFGKEPALADLQESVMKEDKVLVGCYRNWSTKTPSEKAKAYQEEAGADYAEVRAELQAIAGYARRDSPAKIKATKEQQMVYELQGIFCKGRYRSWKPSSGRHSA